MNKKEIQTAIDTLRRALSRAFPNCDTVPGEAPYIQILLESTELIDDNSVVHAQGDQSVVDALWACGK